jgi:hypothetical protein
MAPLHLKDGVTERRKLGRKGKGRAGNMLEDTKDLPGGCRGQLRGLGAAGKRSETGDSIKGVGGAFSRLDGEP